MAKEVAVYVLFSPAVPRADHTMTAFMTLLYYFEVKENESKCQVKMNQNAK